MSRESSVLTSGIGRSMEERAASGSIGARLMLFLARSQIMRFVLAGACVIALVLIPRPSQPITALILVGSLIYIGVKTDTPPWLQQFRQAFASVAPYLALFIFAAFVTTWTAFSASNHLLLIPKMICMQLAVVFLYVLGRQIGSVPFETLMRWIFGILAVASVLLLVEEQFFILHDVLGILDVTDPENYAVLNRAFLVVSLPLVFLAVTAFRIGTPAMAWMCLALLCVIFIVTHSDSARLVILIGLICLLPGPVVHRGLLNVAVVGAVVAMLIGPFVYDGLLQAWKASPYAGFKIGTFLSRLETYADFSALIRESWFLGRGLDVSKLIANDPSLFAMPNRPCGTPGVFCPWHPHNAGLQIATDLGLPGVAWLSVVLWRLRSFAQRVPEWSQPGVIAMMVGFLAVSFVADGLWQPWWWLVAGLIGMWIGILLNNPKLPDQEAEPQRR